MAIIVETHAIPEQGTVELNLSRSFEIRLTADGARRKVSQWLMDEISMFMRAESPTLVVKDRIMWRVPIAFTAPDIGRAGVVGAIDVDVTTGLMDAPFEQKPKIERQAKVLAKRLPAYRAIGESPAEYLATDTSVAPRLALDCDGLPVVASPP